jgi:hypothetical protein
MKTKSLMTLLALPFTGMLLSSNLSATLLVYEGFDYDLTDATSMSGEAITALGMDGSYSETANGGSSTYSTTDLSFGSNFLSTTGGSLFQTVTSPTGSRWSVLTGNLTDTATSYTGTLYSSYLVNFTSFGGDTGAAYVRVKNDNDTNRLISAADYSGATATSAVSYDADAVASESGALLVDTTYLVVSRYTNILVSGGGTADQFIFTLADYESWLSDGSGLETNIGSYATYTATDTSTETKGFTHNLQFAMGTSEIGTESAYFDELRYGSSLSDVVAVTVPEPATFALLMGLSGAVLLLRRRR